MNESLGINEHEALDTRPADRPRAGGRPTKAAARERDARLIEIATDMFLEHGFEGTSMERLAEAAMIGKATLYARYPDKGALFADVLRRRIIEVNASLEAEFETELKGRSLEATLVIVARRMLDLSVSPAAVALGRILAAQGARFPELGKLAAEEGLRRKIAVVEHVLARFATTQRYAIADTSLLADLFLGIVLGRVSQLVLLGVPLEPEILARRAEAAVTLFLHGALAE
jgi:AcrR family transcriptional regulator